MRPATGPGFCRTDVTVPGRSAAGSAFLCQTVRITIMARFSWRKWFGFESTLSRRDQLRDRSRPRVEQLEDRTLLSGGALDPNFAGGSVLTDLGSPNDFATSMT